MACDGYQKAYKSTAIRFLEKCVYNVQQKIARDIW
jgi:hypothetical protein